MEKKNVPGNKKAANTVITVHDKFVVGIWETSSRRISGRVVVDSLFSVESFSTTKKPEHLVAKTLAKKVIPGLREIIESYEAKLTETLKTIRDEVNERMADPLLKSIEFDAPQEQTYELVVDGRHSWPLVNRFVRSIVLVDEISQALRQMYLSGFIDYGEYKKREKKAAKPIWQCMTRLDEVIKHYHQQRKQIAAITTAANVG
ncbi:hypothetical protein V1984_31645 [Pseudomonas aeruginosa]